MWVNIPIPWILCEMLPRKKQIENTIHGDFMPMLLLMATRNPARKPLEVGIRHPIIYYGFFIHPINSRKVENVKSKLGICGFATRHQRSEWKIREPKRFSEKLVVRLRAMYQGTTHKKSPKKQIHVYQEIMKFIIVPKP